MINATPIIQELASVVTAVIGIGGTVLIIYILRDSFSYIKDALGGFNAEAAQAHYNDAYQKYQGSSFEDFEANYDRYKKN